MSYFNKKAFTYDQLIDMIKACGEVSKWDEDRINAAKRSGRWVAEDYPEATEEQKANPVKLFKGA